MATLQGQQINNTYPGLIKTNDEAAVDGTLKNLQDGAGNDLPIQVSSTEINFTGTVSGIPGGAPGLVNGTGSESIQSADFLTPNGPADANGQQSVAIGIGCVAVTAATAIGRTARAQQVPNVAIGNSANINAGQSVGISGETCDVSGTRSVSIGRQSHIGSNANNSVAIGNFAQIKNAAFANIFLSSSVISGGSLSSSDTLMLTPGDYGGRTPSGADRSIILGSATSATDRSTVTDGIAIGSDTFVNAAGGVALGAGVTAAIADTVSVKELETQTVGGGIIMYSPNGTGYKLTVSDAGAPVFTAI